MWQKGFLKQFQTSLMAAVGGIALSAALASSAHAEDSVNVSLFSWPGYAFVLLAEEKGLTPDLTINEQIIEDPMESFSLIVSGRLDATFSTAEYAPIAAEQKLPFKLVAFNNFGCGADKIIVHPDIQQPSDLKGKQVAVLIGGLSHIYMGMWLEQNGVSYADVEFANLIADDAAAAMISGAVSGGEFWEPYAGHVLENLSGSRVVSDSSDPYIQSMGLMSDAIYFSDELIQNRRDVALKLLKAVFDGHAYWKNNPAEANQIIADTLKFSVEDVQGILGAEAVDCSVGGFYGPFLTAARFCGVAPGDPGIGLSNGGIRGAWDIYVEWWNKFEMMTSQPPYEGGFDCSLLADLVNEGYSDGLEPPAQ